MTHEHKLAIIGDGTTAVNAAHALTRLYQTTPAALPPVSVTIFGGAPENACGHGFAFGALGGTYGNLTEPPCHADYGRLKGEFRAYAAQFGNCAPAEVNVVTRRMVGNFHADRYRQLKETGAPLGIDISHIEGNVTALQKNNGAYDVNAGSRFYNGFDNVFLAVGDVRSPALDEAVARYPDRVFQTPYHALRHIAGDNHSTRTVVALGTRSSFVDLVNGLTAQGFQGQVVGVSNTGLTPRQSAPEDGPGYVPAYDWENAAGNDLYHVLLTLRQELARAKNVGVYVPNDLAFRIMQHALEISRGTWQPQRLRWYHDPLKDTAHSGPHHYGDVLCAIPWEHIHDNLRDAGEQKAFTQLLGDLILYARVNKVVKPDYDGFIQELKSEKTIIHHGSFGADDIHPLKDGRLVVKVNAHVTLLADYIVNCAVGPSPSTVQIQKHSLLSDLADKGWLTPHEGTGFDVRGDHAIVPLGAQGRIHSFSGIGLESYGRQVEAAANNLVRQLRRPRISIQGGISHG
ncbi:MAG TPA: FAD/NAD(P)-binding protein [Alphaproteobacteria bacterium]|nr:FAD/NAD(P)-binding protein [Alphaproteobacteria bacterium]